MTNMSLKDHAEIIIEMHEEIEGAQAELAEAYREAVSDGYTLKALRAAIKIHRMDPQKRAKHNQDQMDLVLYLEEIEGRREAAE